MPTGKAKTPERGVFLAIFGAKGGSGKTLLTSNLAAALHAETKGDVLAVDLDLLNSGDLSLLLGQAEKSSVFELLFNLSELTPATYRRGLTAHAAGFSTLGLTQKGLLPPASALSRFESLLRFLKTQHAFILFDCGSLINPLTLKVIEQCSAILLLTPPELLALNKAKAFIAELTNLHFPSHMVKLVLTRQSAESPVSEELISKKIHGEILGALPEAYAPLCRSINEGMPLLRLDPGAAYSRAVFQLTRQMIAQNLLQSVDFLELAAMGDTSSYSAMRLDALLLESAAGKGERGREKLYAPTDERDYARITAIKERIHQRLLELLDLRRLNMDELSKNPHKKTELRKKTSDAINQIIDKEEDIPAREERQRIAKELLDETLGLGPLEDLLADGEVSEIMVNRADQIYVEKRGKLQLVSARFTGNKQLLGVIERIIAPIGRRIDEKTPMVDARLPDGSRVHAIIPPLAIQGPMITIRKFKKDILTWESLVEHGSLTAEMAHFLRACVQARLNIIISGGTGTGKTTLLNILSSFISNRERIITVEDAAELRLPQEHVARLEARPPNLEGEGAIPIRELVRNTLRMRPDRIIVGECRGAEALDMLQAMNTGHDGSLTTIHANSPRDCLSRVETLVMFAGMDLPSRAIREQIASAIDLIIQLNRFPDGSRKITHLTEVTGGLEENAILTQDLFLYRQKGVDHRGQIIGHYQATGLIPKFSETFEEKGIHLPREIFGVGHDAG